MQYEKGKLKEKWNRLRQTSRFRDGVLFLIFIAISTLFWFILAFNDSSQETFNVKIQLVDIPDSVTFISDIPDKLHVSVKDKGSNLWRMAMLKQPVLTLNFNEFAYNGYVSLGSSDIQNALKKTFGSSAQINSISLDSIKLLYTSNPGKKVPVIVNANISPAIGYIMNGDPSTSPGRVYVYGDPYILDTINFVTTKNIDMKDLYESKTIEVELNKIKDVRIIPTMVSLTIPIEPLVKKDALISITAVNVPEDESLLLFPSKVPMSYYVAMSRISEDEDANIELIVDYNDLNIMHTDKLHVSISKYPDRLKNLSLDVDSVEYAVVKK